MANENHYWSLKSTIEEDILTLQKEKVIRGDLIGSGPVQELESLYSNLISDCALYQEYAPNVSDAHVQNVMSYLDGMARLLKELQEAPGNIYMNRVAQITSDLHALNRLLAEHKHPFLAFKHEDEELPVEELKSAMDQARDLLSKIQGANRDMAANISVSEAKGQFSEMQKYLERQERQWGSRSFVCIVLLLGAVIWFMLADVLGMGTSSTNVNEAIYDSILRITLIGVLGAATSFCLRMYRAHVHMARHNAHRQQIANNIEFLMTATADGRNKDMILHCLVQAIATFGPSGLIRDKDDPTTASRTIVDHIMSPIKDGQ